MNLHIAHYQHGLEFLGLSHSLFVQSFQSHFGSSHFSQTWCFRARRGFGCFVFALGKTSRHATPRLVHDGGPGWLAPAHQRTAPQVGEVASQDTTNPSEAGTSSSSAWCAGAQGTKSSCKTCNGPSTACQSRHSPSCSTGEGEEARESSGSHVRRGGASCGRPPCRVEEGSERCRGASIGRSDGAVRIFHFEIAAMVGRVGQTMCRRGRTLDRSQGSVGEVAIGGRAVSRNIVCDTECGQPVDKVACSSRGIATCCNPSSPEDSASVGGGWSTFLVQCASSAHCQCPGRGTLVKLPQLRDAEQAGSVADGVAWSPRRPR